jgi:hypothetical protein
MEERSWIKAILLTVVVFAAAVVAATVIHIAVDLAGAYFLLPACVILFVVMVIVAKKEN